jgi:hypothetical protein
VQKLVGYFLIKSTAKASSSEVQTEIESTFEAIASERSPDD